MCLTLCFQREYDENETDPHHNEQEAKEADAMDLPENIDLEDEKGTEDEDQQDNEETEGNTMHFSYL